MFKTIITICICVLLVSTSIVLAEDVYVTKRGKTYHSEDCRSIANKDTTAIPIEDVQNRRPCKRCIDKPLASINLEETMPVNEEDAVYVTKSGKKYHKQDCQLIKSRDTKAISFETAQGKSMSPCKKCFEEEMAKTE